MIVARVLTICGMVWYLSGNGLSMMLVMCLDNNCNNMCGDKFGNKCIHVCGKHVCYDVCYDFR